MKPIKLTYTDALRLLEKAVADKGEDYKYSAVDGMCRYFYQGQPSCIVGHVFAYEGVREEDLFVDGIDENVSGIGTHLVDGDYCTIELLGKVQNYQDNGIPWGEALRLAQRDVEETSE